jgi:hypothetical protein
MRIWVLKEEQRSSARIRTSTRFIASPPDMNSKPFSTRLGFYLGNVFIGRRVSLGGLSRKSRKPAYQHPYSNPSEVIE